MWELNDKMTNTLKKISVEKGIHVVLTLVIKIAMQIEQACFSDIRKTRAIYTRDGFFLFEPFSKIIFSSV